MNKVEYSAKWIAYFAALWLLLVALAQLGNLRALVVAFAWLIAIATIMLLLDPANPNAIQRKVGLA